MDPAALARKPSASIATWEKRLPPSDKMIDGVHRAFDYRHHADLILATSKKVRWRLKKGIRQSVMGQAERHAERRTKEK